MPKIKMIVEVETKNVCDEIPLWNPDKNILFIACKHEKDSLSTLSIGKVKILEVLDNEQEG
jgi:hypothetical protein